MSMHAFSGWNSPSIIKAPKSAEQVFMKYSFPLPSDNRASTHVVCVHPAARQDVTLMTTLPSGRPVRRAVFDNQQAPPKLGRRRRVANKEPRCSQFRMPWSLKKSAMVSSLALAAWYLDIIGAVDAMLIDGHCAPGATCLTDCELDCWV